jgi:plasmid maintenance system killer protein
MAIRDYRDKDPVEFVEKGGRGVRAFQQCAAKATRALTKLQVVERLIELRSPPSNNFEALSGHDGLYSEGQDILTVQGEPYDVEITNHYD